MKTLKGLLLGSAGAAVLLAAGTVAQAADAPAVAVKGKEPVYRCDTPGFIEYPGSDVCFKIGGYVAAYYTGAEDDFFAGDAAGGQTSFVPYLVDDAGHTQGDTLGFGTNANINIDVRQATEYGIVRVFIEFASYDDDNNDGGPANLRHGFIQVGNWLAGKTWSTFFAGGWPEYMAIGRHFVPLGVPLQRNNQLRYTASLGNGVTASIALEDPRRISMYATGVGGPGVALGWVDSRNEIPDIVGNIRATGSWGSFQVSAAAHEYSFIAEGAPGQEWGWAVNGVLVLNVPSMGKDTFHLSVGYSDGHANAFTTNGASHLLFSTAPGSVSLTETFVVVAGYRHFWAADLRSTIGASYVEHDYPDVTAGDRDEVLMVWGNLIWSPVPNLDVGLEIMYGEVSYVGGGDDSGMGATAQISRSF